MKRNVLLILLLAMATVSRAEEPQPTPAEVKPDTYSIQQEWYHLVESIGKLQKIVDSLTEEVDNFSEQLANEINVHRSLPEPITTSQSAPADQVQELSAKVDALEKALENLTQKVQEKEKQQ